LLRRSFFYRNAAHLKESLKHAKENHYALGVKIVRGAYHGLETSKWIAAHPPTPGQPTLPPPVWQTKPETDACYNDGLNVLLDEIASDVKKERNPVPRIAAILGTHNPESVAMLAAGLVERGLARPGKELKEAVEGQREEDREAKYLEVGHETRKRIAVGQLYGMCDTITNASADTFSPHGAPIVLKYLPYGAIAEVMPYLGRRAIENKTVLKGEGGAAAETDRVGAEMKRRWFGIDHYQ
jgi:proline dehydrogenase